MASILHLPAEITTLIFAELPSLDLLPIRRTCQEFYDRATPLFARVYFQTRQVMFEIRSLDTLVDISKHATFSRHVETLGVCAYHLLPLNELADIEPPFSPYEENDHLSRLDADAYLSLWKDQEQLIKTQYALICLTKAMSNLTHCKRIAFNDSNRPWGLDRLEETIGILPQRTLTFASTKSAELIYHIMRTVLTAVAASELEIEDLDFSIGSQMENANRISPHMLPILPTHITSLHRLHLLLDSDNPIIDSVNPQFSTFDPSSWESGLIQFIGLFPQLSHFMLSFEYREDCHRFSGFSPLLYIPKLEGLALGMIDCSGEVLADLLLRHRDSLREIRFDSINLIFGTGSSWNLLIKKISDHLDIAYFSMVGCMIEDTYVQGGEPLEATDAQGFAEIMGKLSYRQ